MDRSAFTWQIRMIAAGVQTKLEQAMKAKRKKMQIFKCPTCLGLI